MAGTEVPDNRIIETDNGEYIVLYKEPILGASIEEEHDPIPPVKKKKSRKKKKG